MRKIILFLMAAVLSGLWSLAAAAEPVEVQVKEDGNFYVTVAEKDAALRVKDPQGKDIYIGDSAQGEQQEFCVIMDALSDETGDYTFLVNGQTYTCYYANQASKMQAMEAVNSAETAAELAAALAQYSRELVLADEEWSDVAQWGGVYEFVLNCLPYEGEGADAALRKDLRRYTLVDGMNKAKAPGDAKKLITAYNEEFLHLDFGEGTDFNSLDEASKTQVFTALLNPAPRYTGPEEIKAAFEKAVIVPLVNYVHWTKLEQVLRSYKTEIGISFDGAYLQLDANTEAPEVFKQMKQTTYGSTGQIAQRFNELVARLKGTGKQESNSGGGGSGGGGGGRGTSTEVNIDGDAGLALPNEPVAPPTENLSREFSDMGTSPWAALAVDYLAQTGIVTGSGNGTFEPERSVTREEFLKMLLSALELEGTGDAVEFTDVEADAWYVPFISTAKELGITSGMGDGSFGVGQEISRQDMAVFAYRAMEAAGQLPEAETEKMPFADETQISDYALEAAYQMQQAGILSGMGDGTFAPKASATRAQAAKMIYEMIG